MRCYICDAILHKSEMLLDKEDKYKPCRKCMAVSWEAVADDEVHYDLHEAVLVVTEENDDV